MQSNDSSIVVTRVVMEENMFQPSTSQNYHSIERDNTKLYVSNKIQMLSTYYKYATPLCFIFIFTQIIVGWFANSVALLSDATRQFTDHLEQHKYDRSGTPGQRIIEVLSIGAACVFVIITAILLVISASSRAVNMDFEINIILLLIGTVLSLTTNTIQVLVHLSHWKPEPAYTVMSYVKNHRSQAMHGVFNHGLAISILASTVLITIDPAYRLADSITTYINTALILANVAATSLRCYKEYFYLENARDEYQPL